ncbi:MAG: hypothetical protein ACOYMA_11930 [Bacteroidia bacterium]
MRKSVALKLEAQLYEDVNILALELNTNRNNYINNAVELYNRFNKRQILKNKLVEESEMSKLDSTEILDEFELMIDGN